MMTANEKMLKALKTAKTHLENSMLALNKKDEGSFDKSLWDAAAELEYALFLISITFQNESNTSKWKPNPDLKKIETGSILVEAENLLREAEESIANEKLQDAYRSAYIARHYLLKVQENLAKKKREALKNK
jgi:hypothetical protein